MSKNYYYTNQSFHLSEHKVKQIIQAEIEDFFSCIKNEIESKIKQIDKNILDLKADLRKIETNSVSLTDIALKVTELYNKIQEMQTNGKKQMEKMSDQIKNKMLDRSMEKRQDRSPLFRRTNIAPSVDLNNIIFGDEGIKSPLSTFSVQEKNQDIKVYPPSKPPLQKPKNQSKFIKNQTGLQAEKVIPKLEQAPIPPFSIEEPNCQNKDQNSSGAELDQKVKEHLNKNKNSFLRKKSLKKFNTIPEEDVEQSILSTS